MEQPGSRWPANFERRCLRHEYDDFFIDVGTRLTPTIRREYLDLS